LTNQYSKVLPKAAPWLLQTVNFDASQDRDLHTQQSGAVAYTDSFTGEYNPTFRAQIQAGHDATTPATGIKYSIEGTRFMHYNRTGVAFDKYDVQYDVIGEAPLLWPNPLFTPSTALVADIRNRAIRKFLDNAKSARSSFEAGQDLGEIKQTIESLIHPMNSLKELTLSYFSKLTKAKAKYKKAPALHKALSDSYLEYRFGWRPLALDIADAYAGLTNRNRMSSTASCYGSAGGTEMIGVVEGSVLPTGDARYDLTTYTYYEYSYRIKGAIRLNLNKDGNIPVLQALQLSTLNDFAVTAWDLLPYSFVVDYFTNVGDIINAVTFPFSDLTFACGTERIKLTSRYVSTLKTIQDGSGVHWISQSFSPFNAKLHVTKFTRSRLDSLDLIPSARFSLPVSSRPWENIGALLSSNIKSLVPFFK
jgi:hypothetical protein